MNFEGSWVTSSMCTSMGYFHKKTIELMTTMTPKKQCRAIIGQKDASKGYLLPSFRSHMSGGSVVGAGGRSQGGMGASQEIF